MSIALSHTSLRLDIPERRYVPQFTKTVDAVAQGLNAFFVGPPGTGKSFLAEIIAYVLKGRLPHDGGPLPYVLIPCTQFTTPADIIGGESMEGYREGPLVKAWRDGLTVILDEVVRLDANTGGVLNHPLAKTKFEQAVLFNGRGEAIPKHPEFRCILTGNTLGREASAAYVGNNLMDASLLNRAVTTLFRIGYNEAMERELIYPHVVEICHAIRAAILKYESWESEYDEIQDAIGLRVMEDLQTIYLQEMLRLTGMPSALALGADEGLTLRDGLESFLFSLGKVKSEAIRKEVQLDTWLNSYRDRQRIQEFKSEYALRSAA